MRGTAAANTFTGGLTWKDEWNHSTSSSSSKTTSSSTPSSSSAIKDAEEAAEDTKETIDWIETAISRAENAIERIKNVASNVYNNFSKRNRALAKEIKKVTEEIELQEKAREAYLQKANSIGLSPELQEKVKNGTIEISEYDEETAKLINDFKEWYEKAKNCTDSINELHTALSDLAKEKFDNVLGKWEGRIAKTERQIEHIENRMNLRTATSADNYSPQEAICFQTEYTG